VLTTETDSANAKRPPGRPALGPEQGKRWAMPFRTTRQLKERLEEACRESRRSMTQEVELRLEQSFERDEFYANTRLANLLRLMVATAARIESKHKRGAFLVDYFTFAEVRKAWRQIIDAHQPPRESITELPEYIYKGSNRKTWRVRLVAHVLPALTAEAPDATGRALGEIGDIAGVSGQDKAGEVSEVFPAPVYGRLARLLAGLPEEEESQPDKIRPAIMTPSPSPSPKR